MSRSPSPNIQLQPTSPSYTTSAFPRSPSLGTVSLHGHHPSLSRRLSRTRSSERMNVSGDPNHASSSSFSPSHPASYSIDYESPFHEDDYGQHRSPYSATFQHPSQASLAHFPDNSLEEDDEQHLTSQAGVPWRDVDDSPHNEDDAERRAADPSRAKRYTVSRRVSLGGNALRAVSRNLRRVSVRVVDLASSASHPGVKLEDQTPEEPSSPSPKAHRLPSERGEPPPPIARNRLRGKTLAFFKPESRIRQFMFRMLLWTWTEPTILLLIVIHAITLVIQAARTLETTRPSGYFISWEDLVLFVLFIIFSLEAFARIIVSGLLFDPEVPVTSVRFHYTDLLPQKRPPVRSRFDEPVSQGPSVSSPSKERSHMPTPSVWHMASSEASRPYITRNPASRPFEAPFQLAIEKQRSLSEQGRPYLRHSWNRLDFVSILSFWIMFALSITHLETTDNAHIYIFRACSVLKISRLLGVTSGTATIMRSLKKAAPLLLRVATFIIFAMILFSVIGVQSFKGSYRRICQLELSDGTLINTSQNCGGWVDPDNSTAMGYVNSNKVVTTYMKGYICSVGQKCVDIGENPHAGLESFDNVIFSTLQVVVIASVNTWAPVMYNMMDAEFFVSSVFFIIGVIVINFWLLNLFVAVITNTFSMIREETKKSAFGANVVGPTFDEQDDGWSVSEGKKLRGTGLVLRLYEWTTWAWALLALADLAFQASRSANSTPDYLDFINQVELYITIAFGVEIVWRIVGHFPDWRMFFRSKSNILDLFLVIATLIIQIPVIRDSTVYSWLTILQLMRFYRVILFVPRMRPLLLQVFGNMYGLINMTLFLLMMNLIGALIAVQLFRGDVSKNDTPLGFYQTFNALLAMYQIFSSENWTDVMYAVGEAEIPFKQTAIGIIFLSVWFLFANFIMLQMFIAVINENFEVAEEQKRAEQVQAFVRQSAPSSTTVNWLDRWNPYRFLRANPKAIAVDSLPPSLVLPMQKSIVQDQRAPRGRHAPAASVDRFYDSRAPQRRGFAGTLERIFELRARREDIPLANIRNVRRESTADLMGETERHLDVLNAISEQTNHDATTDALAEEQARKADFIASHPTYDRTLWIFSQKNPIRQLCQKMVAPSNGDRIYGAQPTFLGQASLQFFILLSVIAGIVIAAVATPIVRREYSLAHPDVIFPWFEISEATFGLVLFVEFVIKVIADGFIFTPNAYLYSIWNIIDFFILLTLLANLMATLIIVGQISTFIRMLKAFRALRLITMFGWMRGTFHSVIFAGAARILDAAVLAILYMIPYAVWGLNIFSGLMFSCNDGSTTGKSTCVNEYIANPINDTYLGFLAPRSWDNPKTATQWSFDTFRASLLILFETVSLEGWIDVMTAAMSITGRDQQPVQNASQVNAIFFLAYNLLGAVVILTLFVSIIIGNFSTRSGMALMTSEQRQWIDLQKLLKRQRPSRRPKIRPSGWRGWCFDRAVHKHGLWSRMMTIFYCLHIINLTTQTFDEHSKSSSVRNTLFLALIFIYAIDIVVRMIGLGKSYWANGWNVFDVIVVIGSFGSTMAMVYDTERFSVKQWNKLFLVSIAFKLIQRFNGLNQLFKTSVASLPAISKLFLLWLVVFLFFGIAYVEVFALTRWGSVETYNQNYTSFGKALIMLAFMSTGEGWNQYMHDYAITYPLCTESEGVDGISDCGSTAWAFVLFIAWNITSMYIFLNMFTGVVVENFSYVYQLSGPSSVTREEMRAFKKVWADFDPGRKGYIPASSFVAFFGRLSGVFEVRIYPFEASIPNILRRVREENSDGVVREQKSRRNPYIDVDRLNQVLGTIKHEQIRKRRTLYNQLYHEALVIEEPGKGISFSNMLLLLAHYKIIDDEKALKVDEMLRRQYTKDYVMDRVHLDRVQSLLKMIYHRRRYLAGKAERAALQRSETVGDIPEIFVDGRPSTPPPTATTRDITLAHRNSMWLSDRDSPQQPRRSSRGSLRDPFSSMPSSPTGFSNRRTSDISSLSANIHSEYSSRESSPTRQSISPEESRQAAQTLNASMWGEMLADAAEEE